MPADNKSNSKTTADNKSGTKTTTADNKSNSKTTTAVNKNNSKTTSTTAAKYVPYIQNILYMLYKTLII